MVVSDDPAQMQALLQESAEQYRDFFEGLNDAAFVHEVDKEGRPGRFLEVNEAACRRLGYTRDELLCLTPREITEQAEYERLARWRSQLGDRGNVLIETIHVAKDGRRIPVEGNICRITYRGRPAALSVSRDLTERKQMEQALQRRDALLDAAVRASGLLLASEPPPEVLGEIVRMLGEASGQDRAYYFAWQTDSTTGNITISLRHEWVREGITPQQGNPLLQELPFARVAPYSCERLRQGLEVCALVRDLPAGEREVLEPQGIVSLLLMPIMVHGVPDGFLGFDNCRTEYAWTAGERAALAVVAANLSAALVRAQTQSSLRQSEQRYRSLIEHSPDAIAIVQADKLVFVNPATARILGAQSAEELIGLPSEQLIHPEDRPAAWDRIRRLRAGESGLYPAQVRHLRRDGSVVWGEVSGSLVQFAGQTAVQFVVRDVTERKKMEDALRVKEWAISDSINAIALANLAGDLTFVNSAFLTMWGYSSHGDVLGRNATEFWQSSDAAADVMSALQQQGHWRGELPGKRRDGSHFIAEVSASLVLDDAGRPLCLLGVFADITERSHHAKPCRDDADRGAFGGQPIDVQRTQWGRGPVFDLHL